MISYYDIRSACNAMKELQTKPLRRRNLDIHFSIPKVICFFMFFVKPQLVCFNLEINFMLWRLVPILILQDNPSEKDINQGTLAVFNLESSVSNDELCQIFGVHGEIKEVEFFK